MVIDQASLFLAAGICAAALAFTLLVAWLNNRSERFMFGWALGMAILGAGVTLYYLFPPSRLLPTTISFTAQTVGFIVVFLAAREFIGRATSIRLLLLLLAAVPPVVVPIMLGYSGVGIMIFNLVAGILVAATGAQYWAARSEAPSNIVAMTLLYELTALSFFACATILAHEGEWVLQARPDNWAEQFNAIVCIAGITGIGALSLGLNNARSARRHHSEARTDSLTGLLNRRALFDSLSGKSLQTGHVVIAFDLDRFKLINDQYGHAAGDELLRRFADAVRQNLRDGDIAARTGGEEFVLVLRDASLKIATSTAERIRAIYADSRIETENGELSGTASAGVALAAGETFEIVLHRADTTLYRAKEGGRNRVVTALQVVA